MKNRAMRQKLIPLGNGAHALATQILGSPDDAADAVHDAFVTVLQRPQAYDENKGSLKAWFLSVVHNRCIDQIRRRRPADSVTGELVDPGLGPERSLQVAERDQALQSALAALQGDQREIIVLTDYVDLSYAEIAAVLGIPQGTVMSRLHRARLALKEELTAHEQK
jgi:RNA polymerase sigma-70 factor (ECF subfamily)